MVRIKKDGIFAAHVVAIIPDIVLRDFNHRSSTPVVDADKAASVGQAPVVKAGNLSRHVVGLFLKSNYTFGIRIYRFGHHIHHG